MYVELKKALFGTVEPGGCGIRRLSIETDYYVQKGLVDTDRNNILHRMSLFSIKPNAELMVFYPGRSKRSV
jgi:hypothetical protein